MSSSSRQPWSATPQYSLDPLRHTFTNTCTYIWAHTYARPQPTLHHVRGSNVRTGYEPPRIYGVDRLRACTPLWGEQVTSLRFPPGAEERFASPVTPNQAAKESVFVKLRNIGSLDDRPWQKVLGDSSEALPQFRELNPLLLTVARLRLDGFACRC